MAKKTGKKWSSGRVAYESSMGSYVEYFLCTSVLDPGYQILKRTKVRGKPATFQVIEGRLGYVQAQEMVQQLNEGTGGE